MEHLVLKNRKWSHSFSLCIIFIALGLSSCVVAPNPTPSNFLANTAWETGCSSEDTRLNLPLSLLGKKGTNWTLKFGENERTWIVQYYGNLDCTGKALFTESYTRPYSLSGGEKMVMGPRTAQGMSNDPMVIQAMNNAPADFCGSDWEVGKEKAMSCKTSSGESRFYEVRNGKLCISKTKPISNKACLTKISG